jgi:hypothetical protein
VPFPLKDMSEVASAVSADNLGAQHAVRNVLVPLHGPRDAVEVGRPSAARLELVRGLVERRITPCTSVDAFLGGVLVVLARERRLSTLLPKDAELFWLDVSCWVGSIFEDTERLTLVQNYLPFFLGAIVRIRSRHIFGVRSSE